MKEDQYNQLEIQALGRPCSLGQLYNAATSKFLNEHLFDESKIQPTKTEHSSTFFNFVEVKSLEERANSLDISASLTVTIMGGLITAGGFGSYVDRKDDSSESKTIAAVFRNRVRNEYLNVQSMQTAVAMSATEIELTRATHVVTAITYGGNAIGSLTEKDSKSSSKKDISGGFNLEAFKGVGKAFSAEGKAQLDSKVSEKLNKYNLDIRLVADFVDVEAEAPTNAADLIVMVQGSAKRIGNGVPCDVVLTPIARFGQGSKAALFRDLAEADLKRITDFYDRLITLNQKREYLLSQFETNYAAIFPSFLTQCRTRANAVDEFLRDARKELAAYLEDYRNKTKSDSAETFLSKNIPQFTEETKLYDQDRVWSEDLLERKRAAEQHGFPLIAVERLRSEMDRSDKATLALVIVPETVGAVSLLNTYRVLADDIRKWRAGEDERRKDSDGQAAKTVYFSIYTDPKFDADLFRLEGPKKSISAAVKTARADSETSFLTFGLSRDNSGELEWNALNQEGWGILVNKEERWRYIGTIRKGIRHGSGVVSYADGSTYDGMWFQGYREGYGKLSAAGADGKVTEQGVYIDNRLRADDGVVVDVTVYRNDSPVDFAHVPLRSIESVSSHINRIAKVLGWELEKKYRVSLVSSTGAFAPMEVKVNGSRVDPSEDPDLANSFWPLDDAGEKKIKAVAIN